MIRRNKAAIVTGASRGIGKGIAMTLAEKGYDLFLTHVNEEEEIEALGRTLLNRFNTHSVILKCDLTEEGAPERIVREAIEAFGRIQALVNNAGVTKFHKVTDFPLESMDYLYKLNFRAPMLTTKHMANHMVDHQITGSIINITSSRAERAYPLDSVYGGMKAALMRASQSTALELAPYGIRVNSVGPGAIQVRDNLQAFYNQLGPKIPLGRAGQPQDIAQAVAWLISKEASYITGIHLRVDGGLILPGMPEAADHDRNQGWGHI
jgi:glucose 1-dehydrogenase